MKNIFASIFIVTILYSCEFTKEIDYRTIYDGDQLMVQGYISPQDGVWAIVKKTLPPNRVDDDDRVTHAIVIVYENDKPVAILNQKDDYFYESDKSSRRF